MNVGKGRLCRTDYTVMQRSSEMCKYINCRDVLIDSLKLFWVYPVPPKSARRIRFYLFLSRNKSTNKLEFGFNAKPASLDHTKPCMLLPSRGLISYTLFGCYCLGHAQLDLSTNFTAAILLLLQLQSAKSTAQDHNFILNMIRASILRPMKSSHHYESSIPTTNAMLGSGIPC